MSEMLKEIGEQPDVVADTLDVTRAGARALATRVQDAGIDTVVTLGRGSSGHAALYARYLLEGTTDLRASVDAPSLRTIYGADRRYERTLAIAFSQSGETPEIVEVARRARANGALTAAVTSSAESALAGAVNVPLVTAAGEERSVAATKTFTAQLAATVALASALGSSIPAWAIERIAPAMALTLGRSRRPADAAAQKLALVSSAACVARGFALGVALETALKLKEVAGIWAEGLSAADLRHGPISALESGTAVVFGSRGIEDVEAQVLIADLRQVGTHVIPIGVGGGLSVAREALPDELLPFVLVIPAQILAERAGRLRGRDPDRPPGLSKVTLTH